ncbi:hypothetical protein AWM75_04705 [Aerococcus urinaehominis]|uniref:RNA-binding protein KhpB n=1 Tax=Aerococcus urinaehominis TaxID=128944 RepID=A0A120IAW4_9LACT|nr:RNA-binding cell elongation regulator Jag/EloR [Aerococcus urinaehominis]AMB99341.1 hypothetical protein AWM75_04705 [Aerococcus urinaehominis]SDM58501.1 spoIIIJ-associated protein [Aerococcus urinaehominis]
MATKEFQAASIDEAIAKGLKEFGISDQGLVTVDVVQAPKKGFLGFGAKDAIIVMTYNQLDSLTDDVIASQADQQPENQGLEKTDADNLENQSDLNQDTQTDEVTETDVTAGQESLVVEEDQASYDLTDVASYLRDVCVTYGADVTIDVVDDDKEIIFQIESDKPGLVIGKHGKIVNALETLAQSLVHRHIRNRVNVVVNVGDYRERRLQTLERLAHRTAKEVAYNKQPVFLEPLPASERKIIHSYLAQYRQIKTHSEGKEPNRYLVVDFKSDY